MLLELIRAVCSVLQEELAAACAAAPPLFDISAAARDVSDDEDCVRCNCDSDSDDELSQDAVTADAQQQVCWQAPGR